MYQSDGDYFILIQGFYSHDEARRFKRQFHPTPTRATLVHVLSSITRLNLEDSSRIVNLKMDLGNYVRLDGY